MPLIRCPQCSQAYDIPPAVAVRLPVTVANCSCGFWLCGDREKLLHQMSDTGGIEELDVSAYRVDDIASFAAKLELDFGGPVTPAAARHVHVVARGSDASIDTTFTILEHPLWIGRKGCHIEFDDAELSLQHCSISVRGNRLVVRDAESHTGTFLDGEEISEKEIDDGVHLLRVGRALLCLEPVETPGRPVEPLAIDSDDLFEAPQQLTRLSQPKPQPGERKLFLRGVGGPATGMEYDLELASNTVGREGSIRVPDEYLSRKHFEIFKDDEGNLRIRDLGSRNGTFLNTLPARNTKVTAGDEIRAGMTIFRVEAR